MVPSGLRTKAFLTLECNHLHSARSGLYWTRFPQSFVCPSRAHVQRLVYVLPSRVNWHMQHFMPQRLLFPIGAYLHLWRSSHAFCSYVIDHRLKDIVLIAAIASPERILNAVQNAGYRFVSSESESIADSVHNSYRDRLHLRRIHRIIRSYHF